MKEFAYKSWLNTLKILLGVFLILTALSFWYVNVQSGYEQQYITYSAELRVLFERFVRHAGESVNEAKPNAFTYLKYRTNEFSAIIEILKRGKMDYEGKMVLPPSPKYIQEKELAELARLWTAEKENAEFILDHQALLINLYSAIKSLADPLQKIQDQYTDIMTLLAKRRGLNENDTIDILSQINNASSIQDNLLMLLGNEIDVAKFEKQVPKAIAEMQVSLNNFKVKYNNDVLLSKILDVEKAFVTIKDRTSDLVDTAKTLVKIRAAWNQIYNMIPRFLDATTNLEKAYADAPSKRFVTTGLSFILMGITFIILALLLFLMYQENIFNLNVSEEETKKLQTDIEKLVVELKDLANGNLTVSATGGEGVMTAVAEAVNFAINALRRLVVDINQTSQKVTDSATQVKSITKDLSKAINEQSTQILNTGHSVNTIATSIEQVANNAKKSALVASESVDIAHEGAIIVNNTISGMERIREQIRETEKRIQRLGESTQEIGEIVSLIDGISEQTNILSLNAAIQAAMAGDVGMGFAVVADEVQQLAVKSSEAAKEVDNIVKAVRSDTSQAAESMERAIAEVTMGTNLAHDAGRALAKIETVSKNLAELIQDISKAAEEQSTMSTKITKMMDVIEAIAKQTASGTDTTAESVSNLDQLVRQLHESVSEFKLPDAYYGKQ